MGADQSQLGCGTGVTSLLSRAWWSAQGGQSGNRFTGANSLFSRAEWRAWRLNWGSSVQLAVSGRYHYNQMMETKYDCSSRILGSGMSGPVRLARGKAGTAVANRQFAVKTFKLSGCRDLRSVKREVQIFLVLDHPTIARLEDIFETITHIHLVMERLEGGELFDRIVTRGAYAEKVAVDACAAMFQAVAYLHSQQPPIVHRDLKPENFMYEQQQSDHLKLIDFGLSTFWDSKTHRRMTERCGTLEYMAPEVLKRKGYTEKCDIFSLGVIAYVLLTGEPPFTSANEFDIYRPFENRLFTRVSREAQTFVRSLLEISPKKRPSAAKALESPWMRRGGNQLQDSTISAEVLESMKHFAASSHFRRACLCMMAWSLTSEDRQHLRTCFTKLDTNGDGQISLNEMRQALEENFSINCDEAAELFGKLDTGGDEQICYSEFLAAAMQEKVRMHEDALWATFSRFDQSGKGIITTDDLHAMLDPGFEGVDAADLMREVDPMGQGTVSCKDFVEYLMLGEGAARPEVGMTAPVTDEAPAATEPTRAEGGPSQTPSQRSWHLRLSFADRLIDMEHQRELRRSYTISVSTPNMVTAMDGPLQRLEIHPPLKTW